jgi:Family of unknown function (DUF6491)
MPMCKHIFKQAVIIFTSSILVACAGAGKTAAEDDYAAQPRGNDCISQMSIRDYQVLDDSNLLVNAGAQRQYHVALTRRAYGLRSTWRIGFKSSSGQVCSGFSDLIVDDGLSVESIPVRSIRRLTPEEYEDLMVRFGKKEPDVEQTEEAPQVEGAEVEELD